MKILYEPQDRIRIKSTGEVRIVQQPMLQMHPGIFVHNDKRIYSNEEVEPFYPGDFAPNQRAVWARVYTDNHDIEEGFDAEPWFAQASDNQILALAQAHWTHSEATNAIAEHIASHNPRVAQIFQHIHQDNGFQCRVHPDDAREWIAQHRPELYARLDAASQTETTAHG